MKTIDDPGLRATLVSRVEELTPSTSPVWGKMTCQQMLVHVADGMQKVLDGERFEADYKPSRFMRFVALRAPVSWPRGLPTAGDPASLELDEGRFEGERARTVETLEAMAAADGSGFAPAHPAFGPMSREDWLRWAQRHLDHHLKQFGV